MIVALAVPASSAFAATSSADWVYTADGFVADQLGITAGDGGGNFEVEFRIHYGNDDLFWVETTPVMAAGEFVTVDVVVPLEAFMVFDQARWLSDLAVTVRQFEGGEVRDAFGAPILRVAWDDPTEAPYVFDEELGQEIAPGDAWDLSAPEVSTMAEPENEGDPPEATEPQIERDPVAAEVL